MPLYRFQKPGGSPITRMCQVLAASFRKWDLTVPNNSILLFETQDKTSAIEGSRKIGHTDELMLKVMSIQAIFCGKLRTTRSWSFLKLQHYLGNPIPATELHSSTANGADTITGLIDSESKSFNDQGMGPIPKRWKGTCQEIEDFPASNCNRKIIGARHFDDRNQTSRDVDGHGSHTSSTIDRHVYANVVLGTNQVIKGGGIQFSGLSDSPKYPLIDGVSAKVRAHNISDELAR
ncbi:hypothetical protein POM88_025049 [Heracleum sosnowskyi]|uniref:Peptidase S8/S53 domain-containing protein n=1 Tax=Heracleum sosnowskyi TaxID=360622 RepID=A0AAD8I473_9APIA|nr:hypothetical protein POM88_025049 [Heracleum sosnowskyi]